MRKSIKAMLCGALSAVLLTTGIVSASASELRKNALNAPEEIKVENLALNKQASFRSLTDMSEELEAYAYYPDGNGDAFPGEGAGQYVSDMAKTHLTDGESADWMGFKASSTAKGVTGWAYIDLGNTYDLTKVKLHLLSAWCFTDFVVQVSSDFNFAENVTTLFSTVDELKSGETAVYSGGKVGLDTATISMTGWNGLIGVDSMQVQGNVFACDTKARYVRATNSDLNNGGATGETVFTEIEVYGVTSGVYAPTASASSGYYGEYPQITLSAKNAGAEIYYTLDGSYPTLNSLKYEGAITLGAERAYALQAISVVDGKQSLPCVYQYKLGEKQDEVSNKALGKQVSFRSLSDMSVVLDAYAYYPDGNSSIFAGGGQYDLATWGNMERLTDGEASNWGAFNSHSTAAGVQGWAFLDLGESMQITEIKVHMLAAWCFTNVVVQVSDDPMFTQGVTTIFSTVDELKDGETVVYGDGKVGLSEETRALTGWNGQIGVDSMQAEGNRFSADVTARYVRITNTDFGNGGATGETVFNEIQVFAKRPSSGVEVPDMATQKAVTSVKCDVQNTVVKNGTALPEVIAGLPQNVTLTLTDGSEVQASAIWSCENYSAETAGKYTFVLSVSLPENVADVFEATKDISVEIEVLSVVDKVELKTAVSNAENIDTSKYTPLSVAGLQNVLAAANSVLADDNATQQQVDDAKAALVAAIANLVEKADKTQLNALITECEAINLNEYLSSGKAAFESALASARTIAVDDDALISQVNGAISALEKAKNALEKFADTTKLAALVNAIKAKNYNGENYTVASFAALEDALTEAETALNGEVNQATADKLFAALENAEKGLLSYGDDAALKALIAEVKELKADDYTKSTFDALSKAISHAETFVETKHLQSEIDDELNALTSAKTALIYVSALKTVIIEAEQKKAEDYTDLSFAGLKAALNNAKLIVKDENASKEDISAAKTALETAISKLKVKPVDSSIEDSSTDGGCKSTFAGTAMLSVLTAIAFAVIRKKNEQ